MLLGSFQRKIFLIKKLTSFGSHFVTSSAQLSGAQRLRQNPFSMSKSEILLRASLLQSSRLSGDKYFAGHLHCGWC